MAVVEAAPEEAVDAGVVAETPVTADFAFLGCSGVFWVIVVIMLGLAAAWGNLEIFFRFKYLT